MRQRAPLTVQVVVAGIVTFAAVACALMAVSLLRATIDGWRPALTWVLSDCACGLLRPCAAGG